MGAVASRSAVTAAAAIVAEPGPGGGTRLPVVVSQAPLLLRRTPGAVYLVGGAAGPLGGDTLRFDVAVRSGAALRIRTAAASVALPGRDGEESVFTVTATVGADACLEFLPEPVIVATGARHRVDIRVDLAQGARLVLRDELLLGRHGEAGGACRTTLSVNYAGLPILRHGLEVSGTDEVSRGPAILAGHRAVGTLLHVGFGPSCPAAGCVPDVAVMQLAGPGVLVTALAPDSATLRSRLLVAGRFAET